MWPVKVLAVTKPGPNDLNSNTLRLGSSFDGLTPDALVNLHRLRETGIAIIPLPCTGELNESASRSITEFMMRSNQWIVDGLFGLGLARKLQEPFTQYVAIMNASMNPILSIDIPSGLDCDTGEPLGVCVRATHTATFVAPKLGFTNPASKHFTGEVHVLDIGIPRALLAEYS
jgi:NAD(P)H-hydrate epimerase